MRHPATLITFDNVDFASAWDLQRRIARERASDRRPDTLMLLEHNPVFTIGRSGRAGHWGGSEEVLRGRGLPVFQVERGGSVTYHGPGQIVGYPILRLRSFCSGPKRYMRMLEEVVIRVLAQWHIRGRRLEKLTGVWVGDQEPHKIAAMGVRITDGVTMHGFALNVTLDLEPFQQIQPCGIPNCRVTSMADFLGQRVDVVQVRSRIAQMFSDVFGLQWVHEQNGDDFAIPPHESPLLGTESLPLGEEYGPTPEVGAGQQPSPWTTGQGGWL